MTTLENIQLSLQCIESLIRLNQKTYYTTEELAELLNLTPQTILNYVNKGMIPFHKPAGRRLYFKRSEIDSWLENDREAVEKQ